MIKVTKVKTLTIILLAVTAYLSWPIYEFYAHKGKLPFPAFYTFTTIPSDSPQSQKIFDENYNDAGNTALSLLSSHKSKINTPAISAAVSVDGKLVWAGASGWANITNKKAVTTNTQFRIGSTSKALTSVGLSKLVDNKSIDLDKPISDYIDNIPADWKSMTSRQLASHTAGLPHYKENTDYVGLYQTLALSTNYNNVLDSLSVFDDSELLYEPGTNFSYSSYGTVLLSAVMQGAANADYLDIMNKQVFTPLNMTSTFAEHEIKNKDNLASFYWNAKGDSQKMREWRQVDLSHRLAGGGFVSTPSDLVTLGAAMLGNEFVSNETVDTMWTPQVLSNGIKTEHGYALGWRVFNYKINDTLSEIKIVNHGGVSRGAQSWLMILPEYNMSVAVNINSNTDVFWHFGKISMLVAEQFLKVKPRT